MKKYKSVIREYYTKYNNEITLTPLMQTASPLELLKRYLTSQKVSKEGIAHEENVLHYWMLELIQLPKDIRKDQLDTIIEAKKVPDSKEYFVGRLKNLWLIIHN